MDMLKKLIALTTVLLVVALQIGISGNDGLSLQDKTIIENGIELVHIPAGSFMMGTPDDEPERARDEYPVHRVTISKAFYIGKYELTQAQYASLMGDNPSKFKGNNLPVDRVTWYEAVEFCKKLSEKTGHTYRLPTEAEWEYACRASTTDVFYWGDNIDDSFAWYRENSEGTTHPVGMKKPNPWGLYDICGNIEEWCSDWYNRTYGNKKPVTDPRGPDSGEMRVRRGGCWYHLAHCLRSGNRFFYKPDERHDQIGFRVVRQ